MKEEIEKSLENLITKLTKQTENKMRAILVSKGKADSRLMKTVRLQVKNTNTGYQISTNMPEYAKYVNSGRKPGKQPPLKAIVEWCKRKNITQKASYPIARKIGLKGIKPTNFMDPLYNLKILLLNQMGKTLKQSFMLIIKELNKELKNK